MFLLIFIFGLVAGFVDAIAGGGGAIMLPGLLLTGTPAVTAIATNKFCGTAGALTSLSKYAHHGQVCWSSGLILGFFAVIGSFLGSQSIGRLPSRWAEPTVLVLLIGILLFILLRPSFGTEEAKQFRKHRWKTPARYILFCGLGFVIGFHDGFFGPGTGTFLIFVLLALSSVNFLQATGTAKVVNFLTNVTALISFIVADLVDYEKGLAGAAGVAIGAYLGSHTAVKKGSRFVRPIFIAVSLLVFVKVVFLFFD